MDIQPARIARDIDTIASFSESPANVGYSRPTFSAEWVKARDYVIEEATKIGCICRTDSAGNTHIRPAAFPFPDAARAAEGAANTPLWLSGSHLDSVPTGGKFDGVVGCVAPLEVLRAKPDAPLELVLFAEEEGTTFNLGMLGSRTWAGTLSAVELGKLKNKAGQSPIEAGQRFGVEPARFAEDKIVAAHYRGFIEVHIEQGLSMWNAKQPVAVVTAINGRRQFWCQFTGTPNHAGSTKMPDRADALTAAAQSILALESLARYLNQTLDHTVITVGRVEVSPNALNVIPGQVRFSIDLRARTDAMLERGEEEIRTSVAHVASTRKLPHTLTRSEMLPALPLNANVIAALRTAAKSLNIPLPDVASGALHDAAILAPLLPTAMLFVPSQAGISHNPAEFSRLEDIALATQILAATVCSA
jgi:hydantoinase/carbamoylase family amidase